MTYLTEYLDTVREARERYDHDIRAIDARFRCAIAQICQQFGSHKLTRSASAMWQVLGANDTATALRGKAWAKLAAAEMQAWERVQSAVDDGEVRTIATLAQFRARYGYESAGEE